MAVPAAAEPPSLPGSGLLAAPSTDAPMGTGPAPIGTGITQDSGPVRLGGAGGFGFPLGLGAPPPGAPGRGWTIMPSLGLTLTGTDNALQTSRNRQADLITTVSPGLFGTVDTARLQGTVNYAPLAQIYASTPDQDRLDHRFNGQALATLVPQTLFLDLRGAAGLQTVTGGFAPEGTAVVDRRNQVQTTSLQISPYLVHRFGGLATAQVGYAFQYVNQDASDSQGGSNALVQQGSGQPFFTSQNFTAHEGYGVLRSGEDFGRVALEGRLTGTTYVGTGVLDGAHRYRSTIEARYALTRAFAALVEGGYEDQRYGGLPPINIQEPIWAIGARLTPSPESVVIAKYGHRDGFDSFFLDAAVSLGGRTRLFANYSERLTTSAQQAADLLSTTTLDELGNPVDAQTGAPVAQPFNNSFFAAQSSLLRVRAATASISQAWPRDVITLSVLHSEQTPVAVAPGTIGLAQRGTSGSLTWSHALAERTTGAAFLQYGQTESSQSGSRTVFTTSATLVQQLSSSLVGSLQYVLTNRDSSGLASGTTVQNLVIVGLRQTF